MIPIVFTKETLDFSTNGLGRLADCSRCVVTEERNGIYEIEFDYPITGKFYDLLRAGAVVGAIHDDSHDIQPFDIYRYSAPINGIVTFNGRHISYRLTREMLSPFSASSVAETMLKIPQNVYGGSLFTFWTDKSTAAAFNLKMPKTVREILGGSEGSVLDVYSGEFGWDVWTVRLYAARGTNRGVTIRYGKNLTDITHEYDTGEVYNSIAPYWANSDGTQVVYLPELFVTSPNATGSSVAPWTTDSGAIMTNDAGTQIDFQYLESLPVSMDFSDRFEEAPTVDQLRAAALNYLNSNQPWIPNDNITVSFVQLWQTPEYENVAALQRVGLCDRVNVYYPELGVIAENVEIIRVVYNVLTERFDEMELGQPRASFADVLAGQVEQTVDQKLTGFESVMQAAIDKATDLITGGLGGYVVFTLNADGQPQEILIMDTDDINTAVNVIRMNKNGIGFSTTGYNGPYTSAWTIDGAFNADFITAGNMSANIIRGGTLALGGRDNGNGIMVVYDANGNEISRIDNTGATLRGDIVLEAAGVSTFNARGSALAFAMFGGTQFRQNMAAAWSKLSVSGESYAVKSFATLTGSQTATTDALLTKNVLSVRTVWSGADVVEGADQTQPTTGVYLSEFVGGEYVSGGAADGRLYSRAVREAGSTSPALREEIGSSFYHLGTQLYSVSNPTGGSINFTLDPNCIVLLSGSRSLIIQAGSEKINGRQIAYSSSSSRRYKHDIAPIGKDLDPHKLLDLPVRQFVYNEGHSLQYADMEGQTLPGFIAEEVEEVYQSAVIHDHDGNVESWDERRIIPGLLALVQEQQKRIDDLESRLVRLERMIANDN